MGSTELNIWNPAVKLQQMQNELECSVCHGYFVQAHTLSCSHSYCLACIRNWREEGHIDCPICRQIITSMTPTRVLDNMVAMLDNTACRNTSTSTNSSGTQSLSAHLDSLSLVSDDNDENSEYQSDLDLQVEDSGWRAEDAQSVDDAEDWRGLYDDADDWEPEIVDDADWWDEEDEEEEPEQAVESLTEAEQAGDSGNEYAEEQVEEDAEDAFFEDGVLGDYEEFIHTENEPEPDVDNYDDDGDELFYNDGDYGDVVVWDDIDWL